MVTMHAHNVILVHEVLLYMMSTQYCCIMMMKKLVETSVFCVYGGRIVATRFKRSKIIII